jgi:peptide/nickel transport system permease protein
MRTTAADDMPPTGEKKRKESQFLEVMKRLRKNNSAKVGMFIFLFLVLCALLAPLIAPYRYDKMDMNSSFATPSWQHPFGCDKFGRDILSRLLYGARYSLGIGLSAQLFGVIAGMALGSFAGYFGGKVDILLMRGIDILQAIPSLLMAIIISTALGGGFINTVLALSIGTVSPACRMTRAQFLTIRDKEFIEAARSIGCSKFRQVVVHILPNAVSPLIVSTTLGTGVAIMNAAALSFIGLGVQPPMPEWGAMLTAGKEYIRYYPHMVLFPGLLIAITVLCLNMFGDGLRDALDPKLKT